MINANPKLHNDDVHYEIHISPEVDKHLSQFEIDDIASQAMNHLQAQNNMPFTLNFTGPNERKIAVWVTRPEDSFQWSVFVGPKSEIDFFVIGRRPNNGV